MYEIKPIFTKQILNAMLDRIIDEYFEDDYQGGLWEVMEYVKDLYKDEIETLEEEIRI